ERILGLELRAVDEKKRLTLGRKYPWILYRGSQAVLTESILDCLAAERLYGTHLTLISLNGVGCAKYTPEIVKHYGIKNVMLAVDADAAGQECQERILSLLRGVTVEVIDDHGRAGVKDLYALLKKYQEQGGSHAGGNYRENSGV
ncbi:MAG: toprim domain-containing protein, partial [Candidatus Bathyarchaeia archaeon]